MSFSVGLIIVSDRAYSEERPDACLPVFRELLHLPLYEIVKESVISDETELIDQTLKQYIDEGCALIITSGGTGCSPRDNTPEATAPLLDQPTPGVDEAIRRFSQSKSGYAMYSRALSGIAGHSFILNLPGSPKAVREILEFLLPTLTHPLKLIAGEIADCYTEGKDVGGDKL